MTFGHSHIWRFTMYLMTKHIHMLCVVLSFSLFILRFYWLQRQSPLLNKKLVKILPHVIDTVLLASAVVLCVMLAQYPLVDGWLTQKLLAVIAYIVLGFYTFKKAANTIQRFGGLAGAILCIAIAGHTAVSKTPFFSL